MLGLAHHASRYVLERSFRLETLISPYEEGAEKFTDTLQTICNSGTILTILRGRGSPQLTKTSGARGRHVRSAWLLIPASST